MFSAATHRLITIPLAKHLDARVFGEFLPLSQTRMALRNVVLAVDYRLAPCPISIKLIAPRLLPAAPLAVVAAPGTSTATPAFLSISSLVTNAHTRTVLALGTL